MNKLNEFEKIRYERTEESRKKREKLLKAMSEEEINKLIESSPNIQAKIYYSKFKKQNTKKES